MRNRSTTAIGYRRRPGPAFAGLTAVLCAALMTSLAVAQQSPKSVSGTSSAKAAVQKDKPVTPPAKAKIKAKKEGCGGGTVPSQGMSLEPVAGARYACEQPIVNLEPVWSGGSMEFVFTIKNEGTADLNIKAKGG